ncbi:MAG: hypothetical protein U9M97_05140, partial [Candidatus Hadarchaeota archaeon]|nr:hypothetical protein [Candidatus Hadarchaeota archaeon]
MSKKLSHQMVLKIKHLRRSGHSYKEIASELAVGIGTVFKYSRTVSVSERGLIRLRDKIKRNQRRFVEKYARAKSMHIDYETFGASKARIIGHCIFDGSVTNDVVTYTNSSYQLVWEFIEDISRVYLLTPTSIYLSKGKRVVKYRAVFCSKKLCEDLLRYTLTYSSKSPKCKVPIEVFSGSRNVKKEFLRSFWEDEGSISLCGLIRAKIKNKLLRDQLIELHKEFHVRCTPYK